MQMPPNPFMRALASKQKQLGIWTSLNSPFAAEVTAPAGFDWALVDMEHSINDYFSVLGQLQAFAASSTTAIVRPEWNDPVAVKRLLDMGVPGLLFPMIQTVEEAEKAVAATRYPPHGIRGFSGGTRANKFGRVTDYLDKVEGETAVLLQIETRSAIEQAEAIASVDGVDGIFFGPADIAADIGKLGQPLDAAVWDLIRPVAAKLRDMGMPVGTLVNDPDFAAQLLNEGFTFVACGTDTTLLARASDALLANVKGQLK
ncbi:4-hydroxy-2-oxo-heptane-1,7-dioate aldolase [Ascidiaceihabitans donghaensis]|uniref:4-hydroxy-2-oxo-heptane-1,7-dioate aldolase n=1 Tax=Ascidiaceihabitans donghaensis TaxID=1510460 RepID=A0A2R8BH44_9RHOB|nr:HpcH/HpaI aldolase/citrate lyase family protein [Ascidiaceihabitans donghaensis]SPH22399.1 4-hydroxy-2-oxo-heptane-1,7-dioate aldolase [Ascidiaceihabitans donghaensis]